MCESAIEAIICYQLLGGCVCISTAGARSDARWLPTLPGRGYEVHNGFDDGERQSSKARPTVRVRCNEPIPVASGATTDQVVELMPASRTLVGMSRTLKNLGIEIQQELKLESVNIRYHRAVYQLTDGSLLTAPRPDHLRGHFGPTLRSFVLYQHYHNQVTEPLLLEQLYELGISISTGQVSRMDDDDKRLQASGTK